MIRISVLSQRIALLVVTVSTGILAFVFESVSASQAAVFAPERFTRADGPPTTAVRRFSVPHGVTGPFTLTIDSGEPDLTRAGAMTNVARGWVLLNGVQVAAPRDFTNPHIERTIALVPDNVLEVKLVGAAGSHLTIGITGVIQVVISGITPDNGPVDTPVLITGSGFDPIASNNQVSFNGAAAVVLNATTTTIQTIVPPTATTGPVHVTTPHGSAQSAPFTVTSGNTLLISKSPDQPVYSRGQPISISALVVDRHGQLVADAEVTLASTPAEDARAGDTFIYQSDGTFTITATANPDGETLTASIAVTVEGQGPAATCTQPVDGAMLQQPPGLVTLQGTVNSSNGVTQFTVNGTNVAVVDGTFTTEVSAAWGLNVATLTVTDAAGVAVKRTCAFVLSDTWVREDLHANDTISLKLAPAAIDDANRADGLDSFGDILHAVITGSHIQNTLHNRLAAANPLKAESCDRSTDTVFGTICVLSSELTYLNSQLGTSSVLLTPVDGGMRANVRFANLVIGLRVLGVENFNDYDVSGNATFSYVDIGATLDTGVLHGRPMVSVRSGSETAAVGPIQTNFPTLSTGVLEIVVPIIQSHLRDILVSALRNYVTSNFDAALDGVIGGLDVRTLSTTYDVPMLSGAVSVGLNFGMNFSALNTTTARMLFGMGTRFQSSPAHARPSLGTPMQSINRLLDPSISAPSSVAAGVYESVRGAALHALWRGGYFDTVLTSGDLNGAVPAGASLTTTAILPPVTRIRGDGRTELAIGALRIELDNAGLFPIPITGSLAGRVSCASRLDGDVLVLETCSVDDMQFAAAQHLNAATTTQVESLLTGVLGAMMPAAAARALPALPIPGFTLPASLATFGLPTGGVFGIVAPSLSNTAPHHVLRGASGIR